MIAELLKISEEELARIMAEWVYGSRDAPMSVFDILAVAIMTWHDVVRLQARMNVYDAKGQGNMLTVKEVTRLTGLSRSSINRKMKEYALQSVKVDGRRYIFRQSVEAYMGCDRQYHINPWCPRANLRLPEVEPDQVRKALLDALPAFNAKRTTREDAGISQDLPPSEPQEPIV